MRWFVTTIILWLWMFVPSSAEVQKEWWAKEAPSAAEAFARSGPRRIGILLVASDRKPEPGVRYGQDPGASLSKGMSDHYELRLYDALRQAFQAQGYEARCLNRGPWSGLRLREVMEQAREIDAVCAVHYTVTHTHKVWDRENYSWWTPFKGMRLKVRCAVFDVASGDLIYGLEGEVLGTEFLYSKLGEMVAEEPLFPRGQDGQGKRNIYKIAIYHTSVKDPREGERTIPMLRTGKGSLDISYEKDPAMAADAQIFDPTTMQEVQRPVEDRSVLSRLLDHVTYRPQAEDVGYFDRLTIEQCGEMFRENIPKPQNP